MTSLVVKQVAGRHRYFFDVRNHGRTDFDGSVTIALLNNQPGHVNGRETFSTERPIAAGLGTHVSLDVNTGPISVHGDWGVARFSYLVTLRDGDEVAAGEGRISSVYEDLRR